jgi:hypothetical protein
LRRYLAITGDATQRISLQLLGDSTPEMAVLFHEMYRDIRLNLHTPLEMTQGARIVCDSQRALWEAIREAQPTRQDPCCSAGAVEFAAGYLLWEILPAVGSSKWRIHVSLIDEEEAISFPTKKVGAL